MNTIKAAGLCLLLFSCSSPPTTPDETPIVTDKIPPIKKTTKRALMSPTVEAFTPPQVSLPSAQHTQTLTGATAIHISHDIITVDGKKVATREEALASIEKRFYPDVINPLAEALELKKEALIADQGKDNFTRQVLLYADKDTPANLVWSVLFSSAAVGFDAPSLIVNDSSGKPAALALTLPSEGFLRGVRLSQEGASVPSFLSNPLDPRVFVEEQKVSAGGAYGSAFGSRTDNVPEVIDGKAEIRGSLDKDIIRRVIRRAMPGIKFCYEQALQLNSSLAGKVKILFVIASNGAVSSAIPSSGISSEVDACVARKISQLSFPAPQGGGIVEVTYPFIFQTPGNEYNEEAPPSSQPSASKSLPLFTVYEKNVSLEVSALSFKGEASKLSSYLSQHPMTGPILLRTDVGATYEKLIQTADICIKAGLSTVSLPPPGYRATEGAPQ